MDGLETLGQFAGDHRLTIKPENFSHIAQTGDDAMGGFVEDQRPRIAGQGLQLLTPGTSLGRQKTLEDETVRGQTGGGERRDQGAGPRHRHDPTTSLAGSAHQMVTGVAHQGRAGVRYQRHRLAPAQPLHQPVAQPPLVVLVVGQGRCLDGEMVEQSGAVAGIFARDEIDAGQHLQRPRRHIPQIADGRGHHI